MVQRLIYGWLAAAVLLWLPFAAGQVSFMLDGNLYDPDMFTLYGFSRLHDAELFPHDYPATYYLSLWEPVLFSWVQQGWALFADPVLMHKKLPVLLWVLTAPAVFLAGKALAGRVNGYATLMVFSCMCVFMFRLNGGMAHSFGYPLTWWAVAMLLRGNARGLAVCTVLAAGFYPVVAPVSGLALALWLLWPGVNKRAPEHGLRWWKKLLWLCVPGALTLALMWPVLLPQAGHYGEAINLRTQWQEYPEATNGLAVINPFLYLVSALSVGFGVRLGIDAGQAVTLGLPVFLLLGVLWHDARNGRPARLRPYLLAVMFFFLLSFLFAYDHAYRFAIYNVPVLLVLYFPLVLRRFCAVVLPRRAAGVAFMGLVLAYMACFGKAEAEASGYYYRVSPQQRHALEFIKTLPKDVMLAGWPGDSSGKLVEAVPYVAQRQVLVTWGIHALAHRNYVLNLREKMMAVTEAYLATGNAPLERLRNEFGVDYLVVNEADLMGDEAPRYMEPFNSRAKELWAKKGRGFAVLKLADKAAVYRADGVLILDLRKL